MNENLTSLWEEGGEAMPGLEVTATHINYLQVCKRKLWLFAHGVAMERDHGLVQLGKQIGEQAYGRRSERYRELDLGVGKVDHYDVRERVVREVKKSNKLESAHVAQVLFYLCVLEEMGVHGVKGLLEYPAMRMTREVVLTDEGRASVVEWVQGVRDCVAGACPPVVRLGICGRCAYRDFCFC